MEGFISAGGQGSGRGTMLTRNSVAPVDTIVMSEQHRGCGTGKEAANLLNKMENAGYEQDLGKPAVEMGVVTQPPPAVNGNGVPGCTDMCMSLHQQHQKSLQKSSSRTPESPWHRLKSIFLVSIIVILVVWVIVYTVLSQTGVI